MSSLTSFNSDCLLIFYRGGLNIGTFLKILCSKKEDILLDVEECEAREKADGGVRSGQQHPLIKFPCSHGVTGCIRVSAATIDILEINLFTSL
jgi:hypothetical protein